MLYVTKDGRVVETNDEEEFELLDQSVKNEPIPEPKPDIKGDIIPEPQPDVVGDQNIEDEKETKDIELGYGNIQIQSQYPPEEPKNDKNVTVSVYTELVGGIRVFPEGKEKGIRLINVGPIKNGKVNIKPNETEYDIMRYPGETDSFNGLNSEKVQDEDFTKLRFITLIVTQERYDEIIDEVRNSNEKIIEFDTQKGRVIEKPLNKTKLEEYKNKLQSIIEKSQIIDYQNSTDIENDIKGYINNIELDKIDNKDNSSKKM